MRVDMLGLLVFAYHVLTNSLQCVTLCYMCRIGSKMLQMKLQKDNRKIYFFRAKFWPWPALDSGGSPPEFPRESAADRKSDFKFWGVLTFEAHITLHFYKAFASVTLHFIGLLPVLLFIL